MLNFEALGAFLRGVLNLPSLLVDSPTVAGLLRTHICQMRAGRPWFAPIDSPCRTDTDVLVLLSHSTCGACQALYPVWEEMHGKLQQSGQLCNGANTGDHCVEAVKLDSGATRLHPVLEQAIVGAPALALLRSEPAGSENGQQDVRVYDLEQAGPTGPTAQGIVDWLAEQRRI